MACTKLVVTLMRFEPKPERESSSPEADYQERESGRFCVGDNANHISLFGTRVAKPRHFLDQGLSGYSLVFPGIDF